MTTFDGDTPSGKSDVLAGAAESATSAEDETVELADSAADETADEATDEQAPESRRGGGRRGPLTPRWRTTRTSIPPWR